MIKRYIKNVFTNNVFTKSISKKSVNFLDLLSSHDTHETSIGVEAYKKNVIVFRCVNLIAQSASHVPWVVKKRSLGKIQSLNHHPVYDLLKKPNPEKAGAEFFSDVIASKLLYGNAYIFSASNGHLAPCELYLLPASNVEVLLEQNQPTAYKYRAYSNDKVYSIDKLTRMSKILHIKNYNPHSSHYGLSNLEASKVQINLHMQATKWNYALLKNGARPTGALILKDNNGYLNDEQFDRLKSQLYENFTGSENSGKPLLLEGGLGWQEMSINPKDMDFIESKNSAAREIALAFGVPPQLLGINGDNTYSNMQEARLALWEETLIPLLDKLADSLSNWLSYLYNEDFSIDFDRDHISALTEKRQNLWDKISHANFMTINEKRAIIGLPPIEGYDVI